MDNPLNPLNIPLGYCWCGCGEKTEIGENGRNRYIDRHYKRGGKTYRKTKGLYVVTSGPLDTPCWIWQGVQNSEGYGYRRDYDTGVMRGAHVLFWEQENGPMPDEHEAHHQCDTKLCVRPSHIIAVTRDEHVRLEREARRNGR